MNLKITDHAKRRYAERIMDKNDKTDISVFIANNEDKITEDISKMIEYGQFIYKGLPVNENNKQPARIYLKDTWVIILDEKQDKVITLYSIDLGVGKEFNDLYIEKLLSKLEVAKKEFEAKNEELKTRKEEFDQIIKENENTIKEYRQVVKSLEQQNEMYKELIKDLDTNKAVIEKDVREIVGTLIGKNIV